MTEQKANIGTCIFEITRNCNMTCDHCLRGDNPDKSCQNMSRAIMAAAFQKINSINSIVITGGEPTLAIEQIEMLYYFWKNYQIYPTSVYMATNGKIIKNKFLSICDKIHNDILHNIILEKNMKLDYEKLIFVAAHMRNTEEYSEGLTVELSCDPYHEEIPFKNLVKLSSRSYFSYNRIPTQPYYEQYVIARGRNHDSHLPHSIKRPLESIYMEQDENQNIYIETLYISANGNIVGDCDLSYDIIDTNNYGNVQDDNWLEKIIKLEFGDETRK